MSAIPHQSVAPKDPCTLTKSELLRMAEYYLHTQNTLPFIWQKELIARLST